MAYPVMVPRESEEMESCRIIKWYVRQGDHVQLGDPLCEVETEKASFDLEAPAEGLILERFFEDDSEAPLLTPIAVIGDSGDDYEKFRPGDLEKTEKVEDSKGREAVEQIQTTPETSIGTSPGNERIAASPKARKLAEVRGIALTDIEGSGPEGAIVERDVNVWITQKPSRKDEFSESGYRTVQLKGVRRKIAENMLSSVQSTAQFTLNTSASASSVLAIRKRLKEDAAEGDVTINDILLHLVAITLADFGELNGHLMGDKIHLYHSVHLSFAVDTPRGLMAPVIRSADSMSLLQLARKAKRLASACREGTIKSSQLKGGTFTVSNLGSLGIESFTPILNLPQIAILGIGSIQLKPVQREEGILFSPHLMLSLTLDHQAVDGATGAHFLQRLAQQFEKSDILKI
jgi:pyruvate dehydrogenase E2 component (dihydrolipoamide acetyltransferase)